ncbi:MAG: response regulator, partial [Oligoflexia bacterium]|nr:response regulator [Oligoflexia bacterium]
MNASYRPTILIQDDEPMILALYKAYLNGEQYNLLCSANPEEGVLLLKKNKVDIIITDISMPKGNGIDFIHVAKKMYPAVEIIVCSGLDLTQYLTSVTDIGILAVLEKPFKKDKLVDLIKNTVIKCKFLFEQQIQKCNSVVIKVGSIDPEVINALLEHEIKIDMLNDNLEIQKKIMLEMASIVILDYESALELHKWVLDYKIENDLEIILSLNNNEFIDASKYPWFSENQGIFVLPTGLSSSELLLLLLFLLKNTLARINANMKLKYQKQVSLIDSESKNTQTKVLSQFNKRITKEAESLKTLVNEKEKLLIHADRLTSLGILSAGVAHEINNPNTFVRGNLQILKRQWESIKEIIQLYLKGNEQDFQVQKAYDCIPGLIEDSLDGTERIKKIVVELKGFVHSGKDEKEIVNIQELLDRACFMTDNKTKYHCTIGKKFLSESVPFVEGYKIALEQIFVNLIINAADAIEMRKTRDNEMGIESLPGKISIETTLADNQNVMISIEDNGLGIEEKDREKIFDPFFTTKPVGKGTGLGLMVVYNITKEHGGRIEVESKYLQGSNFKVLLPVIKGSKKESANE